MERRATRRTNKRLNCSLVIDKKRLPGIVLNFSAKGLFVQTSANPLPGAQIGLEIDVPGQQQRLVLAVRVARRKVAPPRLKSVVHGGLGLEIENAPEAYFGYVAQLQSDEVMAQPPAAAGRQADASPPATASPKKASPARGSGAHRGARTRPPAAKQHRYRVRVSQLTSSRSRSVEVRAASEEEARREAMDAYGEGWKILACERLAKR